MTRRMLWAAIVAGAVAISSGTLRADDGDDQTTGRSARGLEGSWDITVTPAVPPGVPPPPPFHAYGTFARGGAFVGSDRRTPFASPQHGTWAYLGDGEYAYTFKTDLYDAAGQFQGTITVRVTELTFTGRDEFVGISSAEFRDPAGNVVSVRCGGTIHGQRISVESQPAECRAGEE